MRGVTVRRHPRDILENTWRQVREQLETYVPITFIPET